MAVAGFSQSPCELNRHTFFSSGKVLETYIAYYYFDMDKDLHPMDRLDPAKIEILKKAIIKCLDHNPALYSSDKSNELQEYIIVILEKRKTYNQVKDDLNDFLKDNTRHFIDW
jgi:hypothetical protein